MQFIFAYCTNNKIFNNNKIFDITFANNFPGASWIPLLSNTLKDNGLVLLTGDVVLESIKIGKFKPTDIYIIQEENSTIGNLLLKKGCFPLLIFSGESPLFASFFYKNIFKLSKAYKFKIFFKGAFSSNKFEKDDLILYFPSFKKTDLIEYKPWRDRNFLVMVAANKYWKIQNHTFFGQMRDKLRYIRDKFRYNYYTYPPRVYSEKQLHDKRLELIEYFTKYNSLDLYGHGWDNLTNLPKKYNHLRNKLNTKISINKLTTISKYKFALCLENMIFPGYVTEKIFDCLKSGVIPIYLGAPDIEDYVPNNIFIDLRNFDNYEILRNYLNDFSEDMANIYIKNAQNFLNSTDGQRYSYENFTKQISDLIIDYTKQI